MEALTQRVTLVRTEAECLQDCLTPQAGRPAVPDLSGAHGSVHRLPGGHDYPGLGATLYLWPSLRADAHGGQQEEHNHSRCLP